MENNKLHKNNDVEQILFEDKNNWFNAYINSILIYEFIRILIMIYIMVEWYIAFEKNIIVLFVCLVLISIFIYDSLNSKKYYIYKICYSNDLLFLYVKKYNKEFSIHTILLNELSLNLKASLGFRGLFIEFLKNKKLIIKQFKFGRWSKLEMLSIMNKLHDLGVKNIGPHWRLKEINSQSLRNI